MSEATTTSARSVDRERSDTVAKWIARIRAQDWAHFLVLPLAGIAPGAVDSSRIAGAARGIVIAALVLAFGYLLNGIADRGMDSSPAKNPFVAEPVRPAHLVVVVALASLALALALTGPLVVALATFVALVAGFVYSAGPRLKRRPIVGTLANVACFAPLVFVGLDGPRPGSTISLAAAFATLLVENQLLHEGQDAAEDSRGGVHTTYALLGGRGAPMAMALFGLLAAASARPIGGDLTAAALFTVFALIFPALALRARESAPLLGRLRSFHRAASALAGAVLYVLAFVPFAR